LIGEKTAIKQLVFLRFHNKYARCRVDMKINPNKATANVLAKIATSIDTVPKADNPYIVRLKFQCSMVRLVKDSRKMSEHRQVFIIGENQII